MDPKMIIDGLILYLGLVMLLTFHEFGHAWMAWKCGDDTAKQMGRVSLNPLVHIDLIGTVILPLAMLLLPQSVGRFLVGWAKPVPVNLNRLRNPRVDDLLVTMAGPWMNLLLAVVLVLIARLAQFANVPQAVDFCVNTARLSLILFFFNLLPIPPLDGSRIARVLIGMSHETYQRIAQYGFLILIVVLQIPVVMGLIGTATTRSLSAIGSWFGMPL